MTISQNLLDDLKKRREKIETTGSPEKVKQRHDKGLMTARDRVHTLFDDQTFIEMGAHAHHHCRDFGMGSKELPGDGVVTGIGNIEGRPAAVACQDFMVAGGTVGKVHAMKICDIMEHAKKAGIPMISVNDSGGARIQEGVDALSGYGKIFFHNVELSGLVPQIAIIAGPCAGGAAYSPALTDFQIMTRKNANMFICGPEVIKAVTGQTVTMEEIGSAAAHAAISGNIHFVAEDDKHAIEIAKKLLSFLPSNNLLDPPHHLEVPVTTAADPAMNDIIPDSPKEAYDVHAIIARLVDNADFLEVQREFAKNIVVGFGRVDGVVVGFIANQPMYAAGALDIDASDKAARFIRTCNCFNVPVVNLVDVPGFLPGIAQERGGIIRHGAKMLFAYSAATVPKITMIMRKAYGGAYLAMCSTDLGADWVFAWPTAEIAVMGAEGATKILYKKEIETAADPAAREAELIEMYRQKFASPYQAAAWSMISDVIEPGQTKAILSRSLRMTLSKRESRPPKKHGNIPL